MAWIHIERILERIALRALLGEYAIAYPIGKDKLIYITKMKGAWVVGALFKF